MVIGLGGSLFLLALQYACCQLNIFQFLRFSPGQYFSPYIVYTSVLDVILVYIYESSFYKSMRMSKFFSFCKASFVKKIQFHELTTTCRYRPEPQETILYETQRTKSKET